MQVFLITLVTLFILTFIIWRLSSQRYRLPCPSFLSWLVELENPFAKENQSAQIIKHLKLKEDTCIADIGCGPGRVTIPLSKCIGKNAKLVAIDVQKEMLGKIRKKEPNLSNVELRQARLGEGKLEENKYDYILLVNVLGEIPDQKSALEEIFKALKPDAILSLTETIFDPHFQSQKKVQELTQSIGFKTINVFGKWYSYTAQLTAVKFK